MMKKWLAQLVCDRPLDAQQAAGAFDQIMTGCATAAQVGAMLALIQHRGPTIQEILGAARAMREKALAITVRPGLVVADTCGTGGDHAQTFNISTAAAIVAGATGRAHGMAVAKHGNRSVTSKSGSSQVLEALGVNIHVGANTMGRCLDQAGFCFCFAPHHHPAMKHVAQVRQELGFRTLFNLLGPLTNPAGAQRQVLGVFEPQLTPTMAHVLQGLGSQHAMVVHGYIGDQPGGGGFDELTTTGVNQISHLRHGAIRTYAFDATSLGLPRCDPQSLRVEGPKSSAAVIRAVLAGQRGPARDIVCLNAAAALVVTEVAQDLAQGVQMAIQAIDTGAAAASLETVIRITGSDHAP